MFAIIGIIVVIVAILGGYLMEHGSVRVLIQPAELLIIGGAAGGTVLIANPLHILKQIAAGIVLVFKGSKFTKQRYVESLRLTYELLNKARRQGLMSLETDIEDPEKSPIFSKDPEFLKNHEARYFFCDSMRMAISGVDGNSINANPCASASATSRASQGECFRTLLARRSCPCVAVIFPDLSPCGPRSVILKLWNAARCLVF